MCQNSSPSKVQLQETIPVSSSIFLQPRIFNEPSLPMETNQVTWEVCFFSRFGSNQRNFARNFVEKIDLDELFGELWIIYHQSQMLDHGRTSFAISPIVVVFILTPGANK